MVAFDLLLALMLIRFRKPGSSESVFSSWQTLMSVKYLTNSSHGIWEGDEWHWNPNGIGSEFITATCPEFPIFVHRNPQLELLIIGHLELRLSGD